MVDWSAAATPRLGRDSIWLCHLVRENGQLRQRALSNPPTRHAAREMLRALLRDELAAGRRALAGFDFPLGYPAGFAARLGLGDWRAVWRLLAAEIVDAPDNRNNRFAVAAELNRRIGGTAPFWGCPEGKACDHLAPRHHRRHEALGLAEHRIADRRISGPQPVWKLYGNGSAGSQALTGIPVLEALRGDAALAAAIRIWPFETGLALPADARIAFAEIYPSMVAAPRRAGEVRDSAQMRAIAGYFAARDAAGALAPLLACDPRLKCEERRIVEREEGWILGIG